MRPCALDKSSLSFGRVQMLDLPVSVHTQGYKSLQHGSPDSVCSHHVMITASILNYGINSHDCIQTYTITQINIHNNTNKHMHQVK